MRGLSALVILTVLLAFADQPARAASPFSDWAAIIVAGDDHAHSGAHSEVFDNARRDLAAAFTKAAARSRRALSNTSEWAPEWAWSSPATMIAAQSEKGEAARAG